MICVNSLRAYLRYNLPRELRFYVARGPTYPFSSLSSISDTGNIDDIAAGAFTKKLKNVVRHSKIPEQNSQLSREIIALCESSGLKCDFLTSSKIKRLYNMLLQGKISTLQIMNALKSARNQRMVNVMDPKKSIDNQKDKKADISQYEFLQINPASSEKFGKILDEMGCSETRKPFKQKVGTRRENEVPPLKGSDEIDLGVLHSFLQSAEKQKKEQKQFAWNQARAYEWNEKNSPAAFSPGMMLFDSTYTPLRSKLMRNFRGSNVRGQGTGTVKTAFTYTTEMLFYNLKDSTTHVMLWKNQGNNVHIEYRDLFTVINGSQRPPEQLLKVITNFEGKGWELTGEATIDGVRQIVFKRDTTKHSSNRVSSKIFNMTLLSVFLGFAAYGAIQKYRSTRYTATTSAEPS